MWRFVAVTCLALFSGMSQGVLAAEKRTARTPHTRPAADKVLQIAIADLGNFDYDPEKAGQIPEDVKALTGIRIRVSGYMIPVDQADRIREFVLLPNLFACCFGQPPQVHHTIMVYCPTGKAVSYYPDELTVEGTLRVEEKKDQGLTVSVFEIQASSIKPAR